jgi:cyclophilin family peptidyl-prolyl cis-trans isomerase
MQQWSQPFEMTLDASHRYDAVLETNKGAVRVEFFPEDAPLAVNNFVSLAKNGYYDGTPFHRVLPGFVIQGGDPTGTGRGGPGYQFADEPISREYERGTLAMANAGPNTNGSQFFVVLANLGGQLPKNYTIFGRVTEGMDVVDQIAAVTTKRGAGGEVSSPTEAVTLESVRVEEVPRT